MMLAAGTVNKAFGVKPYKPTWFSVTKVKYSIDIINYNNIINNN